MNNLKGNIPKSKIKGSGFVNSDLDPNSKGEKLLFTHPNCMVIGLDDLPYMLFVTPEFDERNLPPVVKEKILEVKKIVLKSTFSDEILNKQKYYSIPKWLINFNKVEYIDLEGADLDDLELLKECPIKHLIFRNVKFDDLEKVASAMSLLKKLVDISCNRSFSSYFKDTFRALNINLLLVSDET